MRRCCWVLGTTPHSARRVRALPATSVTSLACPCAVLGARVIKSVYTHTSRPRKRFQNASVRDLPASGPARPGPGWAAGGVAAAPRCPVWDRNFAPVRPKPSESTRQSVRFRTGVAKKDMDAHF